MMRRVNEALVRADERLRKGLLAPATGVLVRVLDALVLLAFAALMMTRTLGELAGAAFGARLAAVCLLLLPLAIPVGHFPGGFASGFQNRVIRIACLPLRLLFQIAVSPSPPAGNPDGTEATCFASGAVPLRPARTCRPREEARLCRVRARRGS